jgi:glutamate dehydrogenase
MDSHPLRREIIATAVANAVVNRAGISFVSRLCDETGLSLPVLTRAHVIARDVLDAASTWAAVDALDLVVPAAVQDEMFLGVRRLVERCARWLVHHVEPLALGPTVERFQPGVREVLAALPELLVGDVADAAASTAARFVAEGVPPELARTVAQSDAALVAFPAVALASDHGIDARVVTRIQLLLDDRLALDAVRDRIAALPRADRWQTEARAALRDDFLESQHALTEAVLTETPAGVPEARVDAWLGDHVDAVARYRTVVHDIEGADPSDLAALAVIRRALRELADT